MYLIPGLLYLVLNISASLIFYLLKHLHLGLTPINILLTDHDYNTAKSVKQLILTIYKEPIMANSVTYTIDLTPENTELIDKVNRLLIPGYTENGSKVSSKPTSVKESSSTKDEISLVDFKKACKATKKEHGEDFVNHLIEKSGTKLKDTLGKTVSAVPVESYAAIMDAWKSGPKEEDDGLGDDDDGLGDEPPEVSVEAVKIALKAYAKEVGREEAKKVMSDNGANALSNVDDCDADQLAAMMKALV